MKFTWQMNLALQFILVATFFVTRPFVEPETKDPKASATLIKRDDAQPRSSQKPYMATELVARIQDESQNHTIGVFYPTEDIYIDQYTMRKGNPDTPTLRAVLRAIDRYPLDLVLDTGLRYIILTPEYLFEGRELMSTPSPVGDRIIINVGSSSPWNSASHLHHELYKAFERVTPEMSESWLTQEYLGDHHASRRLFFENPTCFVSAYAAADPLSDRAETFRAMIYKRSQVEVAMRADPCLGRKVYLLYSKLVSHQPRLAEVVGEY